MNRRSFLLSTTGLALSHLANAPLGAAPEPFFDPTYGRLPTLQEQTKDLTPGALQAQTKPRIVAGLPVTGLPLQADKADEDIARQIRAAGIVGVSYAIAVDRRLVAARGLGLLSSHEKDHATPTAPGYIGSITKPLCAMAALTLVNAGKLKLDQRVVDVLPMKALLKPGEKSQPEIDQVTVRMLMNHTSGLFNAVEPLIDRPFYNQLAARKQLRLVHDDISQYDLVRRGMARPFVAKPGTAFNYSGQGMQVLGRIVERFSGQRLDRYMASGVLEPIGVKHHATLSYLDPRVWAPIAGGRASTTHTFIPSPYSEKAKACLSWRFERPPENLHWTRWGHADACGSSMLSVLDLLRFVTFCMDSLGKELRTEALTPPKMKPGTNGLGWGVSLRQGRHQYGHGGAFGGIRAFCESTWDGVQYAVVGACDQDAAFNKIVQRVAQLGRSLRDAKAAPIDWDQYGFR